MTDTAHYLLKRIRAGEHFSDDDFKYTDSDRVLADLLMYLGAEGHHHDGAAAPDLSVSPPTLTLSDTGGALPAGTRVYYRIALVNGDGFEGPASVEEYVDTDPAIATPNPPSLAVATTGGALLPGQYYYAVSAYQTANTVETRASTPVYISAPVGSSLNEITLTLPALPAGATGFNIYRRKPGASDWRYLASTAGPTYVDDGSVTEDATRGLPSANTTNTTSMVTVTFPGATPVVPDGMTWRIYRTTVANDYRNSLLHAVVEESSPGVIAVDYDDLGSATLPGSPRNSSVIPGSPSKIDLATEVDGVLPSANMTAMIGSGALADRPPGGDVPDGFVYWAEDEDGGVAYMNRDTATPTWLELFRSRRRQQLGPWVQDNVSASQTNVALALYGDTTRTTRPALRAGAVTGIVVRSNEARTAGTLTVEVTVNGTGTGLTAVLDGTNTTVKVTAQSEGTDTFAAGAELGVRITTDGSWAPTTADITVEIEITQ